MSVELVKLITGEEFLADVTEKDGKVVTTNPVVGVPNQSGGMDLMPYAPYFSLKRGEDRVIEFDPIQVLFHDECVEEVKFLEEAYCKHFGKILTPGKAIR